MSRHNRQLQTSVSIAGCIVAGVGVVQGSNQVDALSWQELKLAAEAGFEELLRHQEAAAAGQQAAGAASWRCPGMARPKGGGAVVTGQVAAAVVTTVAVTEPGMQADSSGSSSSISSTTCLLADEHFNPCASSSSCRTSCHDTPGSSPSHMH